MAEHKPLSLHLSLSPINQALPGWFNSVICQLLP